MTSLFEEIVMKKICTLFFIGMFIMNEMNAQPVKDGFVRLAGGTFTMGSPASERQRAADEKQHSVTIREFFVDPYEVKQSDYERITGKNPSDNRGAKLPVENVTWYEAIEYCNALSKKNGLQQVYAISGTTVTWDRSANGYRLLTEAEWEYACRAGTTTVFNFG